ncbi:MAG: hypothetical protein KDD11_09845 [Acidobacteria bacterium]|nr:hypothetical protein [Acidobacteriota bacterium]
MIRWNELGFLATLALIVGLLSVGCSRREEPKDPFARIQHGWPKEKVIGLVGEPEIVKEPPFPGRDARECRDAAMSELGFTPDTTRHVLIYLDAQDRVVCVIQEVQLLTQ